MKKLRHALYAVLNASEPDSSDYRIANYLIENIYKKEHFGIQDVADACFVSKSSVSRFCRRIGYADFLAMSQSIKYVQMRTYKRFDEYLDLPAELSAALRRQREQDTGAKADIHEADEQYLRRCRENACVESEFAPAMHQRRPGPAHTAGHPNIVTGASSGSGKTHALRQLAHRCDRNRHRSMNIPNLSRSRRVPSEQRTTRLSRQFRHAFGEAR